MKTILFTWKLPILIETPRGLLKCLALFVLGFLRGTASCGTRKERKLARGMWTPIYGRSIEGDLPSGEHCAQRSNQPSNMKSNKQPIYAEIGESLPMAPPL